MSVRIIFEVKHVGPKIDLRLTTEHTPSATDKEKQLGKLAKDYLDEFLSCLRAAADERQVPFSLVKEVAP